MIAGGAIQTGPRIVRDLLIVQLGSARMHLAARVVKSTLLLIAVTMMQSPQGLAH
jgi:hypothetical protein